MRRWRAFSADRRSALGPALIALGVILGAAAERAAFDWGDVRRWIPDLVVGLGFVLAGVITLDRRRGAGWLLTATGFTWFLGNFDASWLFLHRGPLIHLFVTFPTWRSKGRIELVVVVVGYVSALAGTVMRGDDASLALAVVVVVFVSWQYWTSGARARRDRLTALHAASLFGLAVGGGAVLRMVSPSGEALDVALLGYEIALLSIAVLFAVRSRPPDRVVVADLVVELGETRSGTLRDALATALRDPTLEVGYRTGSGGYVDHRGAAVDIPAPGGGRAVTWVERDGDPFAVLVHDAAVLDEAALVHAVAAVTRLNAANAALLGDVRQQRDELRASRRRLVLAAIDEQRRLAARIRNSVEPLVIEAAEGLRPHRASSAHVARAEHHLTTTVADLNHLAEGLRPQELDVGLPGALAALAERSTVPVELDVGLDGSLSSDVEAACYYVCAEALANVAKHAHARTVRIGVERHVAGVEVVVLDDGVGGADPTGGSGLRGLIDRVEALGGSLTISSPRGAGTQLTVDFPLGRPSG